MHTKKGFQRVSNSNLHEVPALKPVSNAAAYGISLTARSALAERQGKWEIEGRDETKVT